MAEATVVKNNNFSKISLRPKVLTTSMAMRARIKIIVTH